MKRREFTQALRVEMRKRATDRAGNIYCEGCGANVRGKRIEFDHVIPEAMRLPHEMAKPLTADDGKLLGRDCCHRAPGGKTAQDLAALAKAKRREASHLGIRAKPKLQSAGFRPAEPQRRASSPLSKQPVPRRSI